MQIKGDNLFANLKSDPFANGSGMGVTRTNEARALENNRKKTFLLILLR